MGHLHSGGAGPQQPEQVPWEGSPERGEEDGGPEGRDVLGPVGLAHVLCVTQWQDWLVYTQ